MEIITLSSFAVKLMKEYEKGKQPWIYCVIKSADQVYCSKNCEVANKDWVELISHSNSH